MFLWYHHHHPCPTISNEKPWNNCMHILLCISIFMNILEYIYTHPIPIIIYRTPWLMLKLMSHSWIKSAVVNSVFLVSTKHLTLTIPTLLTSHSIGVLSQKLQYQNSLLMLLNPTKWYQLHKGCNNHIIQWTLSYNLIKLQLGAKSTL